MNKRLFLIILATLLILGVLGLLGWFFFVKKSEPKNIYEKVANGNMSYNIAQTAILDTDGDGLRDWEEKIWKTDPQNTDSDKDGYTDKQETTLGYDPTDPNSNPQTGQKNKENNPILQTKTSNETNNLTEIFSNTISGEIKNPTELNQANLSNPLDLMSEESNIPLLEHISNLNPQIFVSEIKTTSDNSVENIKKYGTNLEKAIPENPYPNQTEDSIFVEAITTKDFKKINEYINYFETAITNMKNIVVPSDFAQIHKRQIELLMATKEVYKNIKEIDSDPLKTVLALQENEKIRQEMALTIQNLFKLAQEHEDTE